MIVAVVAEKGGVGKTVVATNLAGMRAAAGFKALLLDVDTQGQFNLLDAVPVRARSPSSRSAGAPGGGVQAVRKRPEGAVR